MFHSPCKRIRRERGNHLVAANLLSNKIQSLNNPQTQLLALLILLHRNILNVAHHTKRVNKLALHNQTSSTDNVILSIAHDKHVILVVAGSDPVIALVPLVLADLADGRQHAQDIQVPALVVGATQWADGIVCWEDGDDFGRDQGGGEEGTVGLDVDGGDGGVHDGLGVGGFGDGGCCHGGSGHCVFWYIQD